MSTHPLVLEIAECFAGDVDDPGRFDGVKAWLDAHRDDALALLIRLATDRRLLHDRNLAEGEVPIAATYFLGTYCEPAAIEPLLELLCSMPRAWPEIMQWEAIWETLQDLSELVIEPAIAYYQRSDDASHRAILATLLGDLGCRDRRVQDIWIAELPQRPCLMATYLGLHGHERALPALLEQFDALPWDSTGEFDRRFCGQALFDLCDAITALSGELSDEQWQKYSKLWKRRMPTQAPPSLIPPPARKPFPGHRSWLPPAQIAASDIIEFHEKGLIIYGSLRNTADMLGTSPAMVHHYAQALSGLI